MSQGGRCDDDERSGGAPIRPPENKDAFERFTETAENILANHLRRAKSWIISNVLRSNKMVSQSFTAYRINLSL